jgi:hypothetical protein
MIAAYGMRLVSDEHHDQEEKPLILDLVTVTQVEKTVR